jgi:hypothetical protein
VARKSLFRGVLLQIAARFRKSIKVFELAPQQSMSLAADVSDALAGVPDSSVFELIFRNSIQQNQE